MENMDGRPLIIGSGLSGMAISDWLSQARIHHTLLGGPPNDVPRLGESVDPAGTLAMLRYYPEFDHLYFRKRWITVFLGDYATSCNFGQNFRRVLGLKLMGFSSPPEFIHVDRLGFDKALYEKVTAAPYCYQVEGLVENIDYDPSRDAIEALHLKNGETIRPSYIFDCTNHVRLLGKALNIPFRTLSEPQRIVFNHYYAASGESPVCDSVDLEWLHSTNILRLYGDIDGVDGLAWAIPLGRYISAGLSMPRGSNDYTDEEVLALLSAAYARRGLDYTAVFPNPQHTVAIPYQQYFFHERAYGKNWLLAGPSFGQIWFPSSSGIGSALVAGYIAADIINRPEEVGQLYQNYIIGLQESHQIFDRMIKRHHSEMTAELVKQESNYIVRENVRRVARLATVQSNQFSATFARMLIKAVSREGVANSGCKVFKTDMAEQTRTIFAE
jgi:flavin-dependent dehydrogenase